MEDVQAVLDGIAFPWKEMTQIPGLCALPPTHPFIHDLRARISVQDCILLNVARPDMMGKELACDQTLPSFLQEDLIRDDVANTYLNDLNVPSNDQESKQGLFLLAQVSIDRHGHSTRQM